VRAGLAQEAVLDQLLAEDLFLERAAELAELRARLAQLRPERPALGGDLDLGLGVTHRRAGSRAAGRPRS
jgi:hypothetical protein